MAILVKQPESSLLGLVSLACQILQSLTTSGLLAATNNASVLVLDQVGLGQTTGSVLGRSVENLGLGANSHRVGHLISRMAIFKRIRVVMATTGGGSAAATATLNTQDQYAIPVNFSDLPIYQFDESLSELRKLIDRFIRTPAEIISVDVKRILSRIVSKIIAYLDATYPDRVIVVRPTTIHNVLEYILKKSERKIQEIVIQSGKKGRAITHDTAKAEIYASLKKTIEPILNGGKTTATIKERLSVILKEIEAAADKRNLYFLTIIVYIFVLDISSFNTSNTLNTIFSGVGGARKKRVMRSSRRGKKLKARGRASRRHR